MKAILVFISLSIFGFSAFAADPADISGCKGAAVRSAIDYARNQYSTQIRYTDGSVVNVKGRGRSMISTYAIGLEQCDSQGCGGLSFDVYVEGKKPYCKVIEVELTGEE